MHFFSIGLDVDGVIVDGVVIEKQAARIIFEKEVRKRIDPGFVELVTGNVFRTRVYPINPQSTRTVRVIYQDQAIPNDNGYKYEIPLVYQTRLESLDIVLTCFGQETIKPSFLIDANQKSNNNPQFVNDGNGQYTARWHLTNVDPPADHEKTLSYIISNSLQPIVTAVEKDAYIGTYFAISCALPRVTQPRINQFDIPLKTICILWDASISRSNSNENRLLELNTLKKIFDLWLTQFNQLQIIIIIFRNDMNDQILFQLRSDNWNDFMNIFKDLPYDGATNLLQLSSIHISQPINHYFLCSDCISTIHNDSMNENLYTNLKAPIWVLNGNHLHEPYDTDFIRYVTQYNEYGGGYLNHDKLELNAPDLTNMIENSQIKYVKINSNSTVLHVYPSHSISIPLNSDRFLLVGQIPKSSSNSVQLELEFSVNNQTSRVSVSLDLPSNGSNYFGLIRRLWAQQKLNELNAFKDKYKSEILSLGLEYSLVSHFTSLLVLENLQQHLQYRVCPAESRKALYNQYIQHQRQQEIKASNDNLEIINIWNQTCRWYDQVITDLDRHRAYLPTTTTGFGGQYSPQIPMGAFYNMNAAQPLAAMPATTFGFGLPSTVSPASTFSFGSAVSQTQNQPQGIPMMIPKQSSNSQKEDTSSIILNEFNSDSSYITRISLSNSSANAYVVYLSERTLHRQSPSFYFDVASYFLVPKSLLSALDMFNQQQQIIQTVDKQSMEYGLRILTNILELELEAPQLYRMAAYKLMEIGQWTLAVSICRKIYSLRSDEPQSLRDLALVLIELGEYEQALKYLQQILQKPWDARFTTIKKVVLLDLNRILVLMNLTNSGIDKRLIRHLPLDIRIVVQCDTADTSIKLHINEPTGQTCSNFYSMRTGIGGYIESSFNQSSQPIEYLLRKAISGTYKINLTYINNAQHTLIGATTVLVYIYKYFGTINEEKQIKTIRLTKFDETVDVGQIEFGDPTLEKLKNDLEKTKEECLRLQNQLIGSKQELGLLSKHPNVSCDGCSQSPIVGDRYKCMFCPNLDFCENCQSSSSHLHDSQHPLICVRDSSLYASAIQLQNTSGWIHSNSQCVTCSVSPIVGIRYQCMTCNVSLCEKCEFLGLHNIEHQLLKIFLPQ